MKLRSFCGGLPLLLLAACSVGSDETGASGDDLTFTPVGEGSDVTVTIVVPDAVQTKSVLQWGGGPAPTGPLLRYTLNGHALVPGVPTTMPYGGDVQGNSALQIEYLSRPGVPDEPSLVMKTNVVIAPGETTTITLGAIELGYHGAEDSGTIDLIGHSLAGPLTFVAGSSRQRLWSSQGSTRYNAYILGPVLPVPKGHYEWAPVSGALSAFDVVPGRVSIIRASVAARPGTVTLQPTAAAFPNAAAETIRLSCIQEAAIEGASAPAALGTTITVLANAPSRCWYSVDFGGAVRSSAKFGFEPHIDRVVTLPRLDVDDVALPTAPGVDVPGTYTVELIDPNVTIVRDVPTKTGLDLPPGDYRVTVRYRSPDGVAHTTASEVTL